MDSENRKISGNPVDDMNEWKLKQEIAHWKSLAISLDYEKKMLENHLRDVYVDLIKNNNIEEENEPENMHQENESENTVQEALNYSVYKRNENTSVIFSKGRGCVEPPPSDSRKSYVILDDKPVEVINCSQKQKSKDIDEFLVPISVFKNSLAEMKESYGTQKSQIVGVETASEFSNGSCYEESDEEFDVRESTMTYAPWNNKPKEVINCSQKHNFKQRGPLKNKLKDINESIVSIPVFKNRSDEMQELYGTHKAQIAGVETALQLNFEHARNRLKPSYWPQLQLNLG